MTTGKLELPKYEEIEQLLKQTQKTTLGSIFPILKEERLRLIYACLQYLIISFVYSFLRIFKKNIIYTVMDTNALVWFKPLIFAGTVFITGYIQGLIKKFGVKRGTDKAWISSSMIFLGLSLLLLVRNFLQPDKMLVKNMFIGKTAELRGIASYKQIALVLNAWVLSLFYVLSEVLASIGMTYLFLTNLSYCCVENQYYRFIRLILASASLGMLLSGIFYNRVINNILSNCSFAQTEISYSIVCCVVSGIYASIYFLKGFSDIAFKIPFYSEFENKILKKKDPTKSFVDGFLMAMQSKLLISMCTIALCFNITTELHSLLTISSYTSLSDFLKLNPSYLPSKNFPIESKLIGGRYGSYEHIFIAIFAIPVLLLPFSKRMFDKYGVALYGAVSIIVAAAALVASGIFAVLNYPDTNNGKKVIFNLGFDHERHFLLLDAQIATFFAVAIKIGKYAFYDVLKEAITVLIDPNYRSMFKGIFDGMCGKLGKTIGSGYGIVLAFFTSTSNPQYYAPVSVVFSIFCCSLWIHAIYYLHTNYLEAKEKESFMDLGFRKSFIDKRNKLKIRTAPAAL